MRGGDQGSGWEPCTLDCPVDTGGHNLLRVHHLYLWNSAGQPTGIDLKRLISGLAGGVM